VTQQAFSTFVTTSQVFLDPLEALKLEVTIRLVTTRHPKTSLKPSVALSCEGTVHSTAKPANFALSCEGTVFEAALDSNFGAASCLEIPKTW